MGVRYREELEKQRKRGPARAHGNSEAAEKRRKVIQRQQGSPAVYNGPSKKKATRRLDGI